MLGKIFQTLLLAGMTLHAADFHPIASISSSTPNDLYNVENLISGPGQGFTATEPHTRLGGGSDATWVTAAPHGSGDYYLNGIADPVLLIDLGANRSLSEISTWGYADTNTNGARNFSLRFATEADGPSNFGTSITYNPSFIAGFSESNRDSHPFSQTVNARYLEMTITDNWRNLQQGFAGGDRVGLGEIAFENTVPPLDPLIEINDTLTFDATENLIGISFSNLGATQSLTTGNGTLTGPHAALFSLIDLPSNLSPGSSEIIQLGFNPGSHVGQVDATLTFTSNDTSQPTLAVSLSAFVHDPRLVTSSIYNLGTFPAGSGIQSQSFQIQNKGGVNPLNLSSLNLTGAQAAHFAITSRPDSIAPLTTETITIQLDPMGSDQFFSAQLEIISNDPVSPSTIVNLQALVGDAVGNTGVRINEFMASNSSVLDDGDGEASDWIELYNAGPASVNLSGWFLTDSASDLEMWPFPEGTTLAANEFLVVFASGQDSDSYLDGSGALHTNFKLSSGGEFLALVQPDGISITSEFRPSFPEQFTDVSYGAYQQSGAPVDLIGNSNAHVFIPTNNNLGLTWTLPPFTPDASWITSDSGTGIGFDNGASYRPFIDLDVSDEMGGQQSSAYIRIPFELDEATSVTHLEFSARYDDGFSLYLNGIEVGSFNAPANPTYNSVANGNVNENDNIATLNLSSHLHELLNGTNILAIHGMNRSATSSDFLIDPTLTARLATGAPLLRGYLDIPTPNEPNSEGVANAGPKITSVTHTPVQPTSPEDLIVTAFIEPRLNGIGSVNLHHRTGYASESILTMVDDGSGDDALAGDFNFTARIPADSYDAGDMVRWFVLATDSDTNPSRLPAFLDRSGNGQSPEYFGTVVQDPSANSDLPVFQWFTQSVGASHNRSGARASVFFLDRFYDNIFVRQRGGFTNASTSQKFDFNRNHALYVNEEMPSVGEININGPGSDSTYIRQPLAFDTHRAAGNESSLTYLWQLHVNGNPDRVGIAIEQVDEDYLTRYDYDDEGDLYKFVQRNNLNPVLSDTTTGVEKKTGDLSNNDSLQDLVNGLKLPTSDARRAYVVDALDLPQIVNYLASRSITQDADDLRKNFYLYQDSQGDCRWRIFPWDKDFTFGVVGDGGTFLPHPFFGDEEHKKQNANQWNVLYDVVFEEPVTQRLYLRRLRTLMDELLQPSSTPSNERILEAMAQNLIDPASPPLGSNISSIFSYLNSRRSVLGNNYPTLIPPSQPANPDIIFAAVEQNPASGDQDQEFIRLSNNEGTEIDISGWSVDGGVRFTFRPGTVIERNGDLYLSPDLKAFLNRTTSPRAGEELITAGPYSGNLSNFTETLTLRDANGLVVDTFETPNIPSFPQLFLAVSEVMYHPADPNSEAEFIELVNTSDTVTLDLAGVHFSAGIDFTFAPGTALAPGERILVVLNQAAFESRYGPGLNIAGEFQNESRLNNGSDFIKLEDASGSTILEFTYRDDAPWPTGPDGQGFSLIFTSQGPNPDYDDATNWRESSLTGGNPGRTDSTRFVGDPTADLDKDGFNALAEHAFGTSDAISNQGPLTLITNGSSATLTAILSQTADDVITTLESSRDLSTWENATAIVTPTSFLNRGDGTAALTYETNADPRRFFRLKVTLKP
ncbi:lamin tail domain-containing protein [Verrucomicrobiaceae bacterium 227]